MSKKNKARENALEIIKETPLKPVRVLSKPGSKQEVVKPAEKPQTNQSKRSLSTNPGSAYRKAPRPVMPFASDPTKFLDNIRREKYNRKKTDLTQFANATFTGGVFVNGYPGQSI